jgi:hypothetical protein
VLVRILAPVLVAPLISGCAAAALPPVMAAVSGGTNVVKAGMDYTAGGAAYRTFSAPLGDVRSALHTSLRDLDIVVTEEGVRDDDTAEITGEAFRRERIHGLGHVGVVAGAQGALARDP